MAERMLFAGMDVGTSGCKMLVYDLDGNIVYQSSRKYQEEGSGGHRELNPEIVKKFSGRLPRNVQRALYQWQ